MAFVCGNTRTRFDRGSLSIRAPEVKDARLVAHERADHEAADAGPVSRLLRRDGPFKRGVIRLKSGVGAGRTVPE